MKRRTPNLLDYIKQPLPTMSRTQYHSNGNNSIIPTPTDKRRHIRNILIIIIIIFAIVSIRIMYYARRPHQISIVQHTTNNSNKAIPNPDTPVTDTNIVNQPSLTDSHLLKSKDEPELMSIHDLIIKYQQENKKPATSISNALSFTNEDCNDKFECGRCWLYNNLNLVIEISAIIPISNEKMDEEHQELNLLTYWVIFRAINVEGKEQTICNAKDITIYVSIIDENSESVGGLAIPDDTSLCGWKYKWIVSKPGQFIINAYLLYYRGYLDFDEEKCKYEKNIKYTDKSGDLETYTLTKLPENWRFYGQVEGCCEWCNRMNGKCKSWSSGGGGSDKCKLYTESPMDDNSNIDIVKQNGYISGLYRGEPQQWYLGSLLNIQPNGCHNTKLDLIYGSPMNYDISNDLFETMLNTDNNNNLCQSNHEMGRWISVKNMDCSSNKEFNSWCWIQKRFGKVPFHWKPYQCLYEQRTINNIHQCLVEKNVNRIGVGGDSLIRLFSLEMVRFIFGEPLMKGNDVENWSYSKHYEKNNIQIWFMGYNHKIDDISFMKEFIVDKDNPNKPNVFIHNFQVIHKIWHHNVSQFIDIINEYKLSANKLFEEYYGKQQDGNWPIRMVFEAPLLVSEREYHDTADRAIIYNKIMRDILEKDGWIFIPVFEISKARMYDSTNEKGGVIDGMHMSSNILIEISRIVIDMLCRFDLTNHRHNQLNPHYMSVS